MSPNGDQLIIPSWTAAHRRCDEVCFELSVLQGTACSDDGMLADVMDLVERAAVLHEGIKDAEAKYYGTSGERSPYGRPEWDAP